MTTATLYEVKVSNAKAKEVEKNSWKVAKTLMRRGALYGSILGSMVAANIIDVKMLIRSESKGSPEVGYAVSRAILKTLDQSDMQMHDWLKNPQYANMLPRLAAQSSINDYLKIIGSKEKAESFANAHPMVAIPSRSSFIIERR